MQFHDLRRPAQVLVIGVCLAGVATLMWAPFLPTVENADIPSVLVYLFLAIAVAAKRIQLHPRVAAITLGFLFVLLAMFGCGTGAAIAIAIANAVAAHYLRPKGQARPAIWATGYNAAALAVSAFGGGLAYYALVPASVPGGPIVVLSLPMLIAASAAIGVFYGGSALALGLVSTLTTLRLPPTRWWGELLATAPVYCAGGAVALAVANAPEWIRNWAFLVGVPFAYVMHLSMQTQASRAREEIDHLEERAHDSEKTAKLYLSIVQALSNAIDVKDHGTHMHVKRVHTLAGAVARRVGLADEDLEAVETGAVLHDIGKLAVPDGVLNKPSRLTDEEFRLIQEHPAAGDAILRPINFGCDVATVVRHHHEKMDGSGYPDGISGDEISVGARVLAVIDIYDALVCDRPYRKAWTGEQALEQLRTEAGEGKLDATVVHALQEVIESGECADELTEDLGDDIWSTLPHLAPSAALDPEVETQIAQARVVEQTRRSILSGVVEYFAQDSVFQACVAYGVNERNGELDAVTAAGPLAESFAMARIPFGAGPSTHAVKSARPVAGASAADEFRCFSEGVPEGLSNCSVTAVPISDSSGQPIAVVSFYLRGGATLPERVVGELTGAMGVLGRQLEAAGDAMDADVRLPIDDSPLPGQLLAGG